jgi:hypothetical protein
MCFVGSVTIAAVIYARRLSGKAVDPREHRPVPAAAGLAVLLSTPLIVSVTLELLTFFSVLQYYSDRWNGETAGQVNWVGLLATGGAALFVGQWHVGPAVMQAWKRTVQPRFRTVMFRRFNDPQSARYVHTLLAAFGSFGRVDLLTDLSLDAQGGTGEPYIDRYFSDHEHAGKATDENWVPKVRELLEGADLAVFVLRDEVSASLKLEMELAAEIVGVDRGLILLSEEVDGTVRTNIADRRFVTLLIRRHAPMFGIILRLKLLSSLSRLRSIAQRA